jgi:hypothetical protein
MPADVDHLAAGMRAEAAGAGRLPGARVTRIPSIEAARNGTPGRLG